MSSDDSIYRPPESSLSVPIERQGAFGSVERGLAGDFEFAIQDVLSQAWDLTNGSKGVLIGGFAVFYAVSIVSSMLSLAITGASSSPEEFDLAAQSAGFAISLAGSFLGYPIMAGMFLYVIKRAAGDSSASFGDIFGCFGRVLPILGLMLLQTLLVGMGFIFFLLPGIYLAVAYSLALPLLVEKEMGIWQALETSRRAMTHCWFRCWGLMVVAALVATIGSVFTFGIGLIWFMPLAALSFGVLYRNVFGYEGVRA